MNIKDIVKIASFGAVAFSAVSFGADGPLDTTSSGTSAEVRAGVPSMIRIRNFGDGSDLLDLGTYDPATPGNMSVTDDFCVYRNETTTTYEIEFLGDGAANAFTIANAATDTLAYQVWFSDDGAGLAQYGLGTPETAQVPSNHPTCGSGNMARVEIRILQADVEDAPFGSYAGDLTATVTVE
jgi:hypothetical protein